MSQVEISFADDTIVSLNLSRLQHGKLFRKSGSKDVYMKLKSVNYLNNSNLLSDVFARGDCLVASVNRGTVFVMEGKTVIVELKGNLSVRDA